MTWPEYDSCSRGYFIRNERQNWDTARHVMTMIYNVNCTKEGQQLTPQQMIRLSYDPPIIPETAPTAEEEAMMLIATGHVFVDGQWTMRKIINQ